MAQDDATGLEGLYTGSRADLYRFLIARTGDPAEAEDILQDLWIKIRNLKSGPIANGQGYLYRMAYNMIVDRVRKRSRTMRRDRQWNDQRAGPIISGSDIPDMKATVEEDMIEREEAAHLASAIANLPEGARRAFQLHKLEGLSHAEVAERLGISKSGVEKHMAVAMKYLRRALLD